CCAIAVIGVPDEVLTGMASTTLGSLSTPSSAARAPRKPATPPPASPRASAPARRPAAAVRPDREPRRLCAGPEYAVAPEVAGTPGDEVFDGTAGPEAGQTGPGWLAAGRPAGP